MTKKIARLAIAIGLSVPALMAAQAPLSDDLSKAPRISQSEFRKLLDTGAVLVIDVRDADSYRLGHIPGAVSMPLRTVRQQAAELKQEKRPIVAYCA